MKYMKRIISMFLVLVLIASICACSKNSENENGLDNNSETVKADLPEMLTPDVQDDLNYITTEVIDLSNATIIQCSGTKASISGSGATASDGVIIIKSAGTYAISGDFTGQICIEADDSDKVKLVLNGFSGENSTDSVIYVKSADKVTIKLQDSTTNVIKDADTSIESDSDTRGKAAIYSKVSLEISGSGTLEVLGAYKHAVATTKKLTVSNGTVNVATVASGLKGNNSVIIEGGAVYISSVGDGIKTEEEEDTSKGNIDISGGKITISTEGDAIRATISCEISGGNINIVTTGNDTAKTSSDMNGGGMNGGGMNGGGMRGNDMNGSGMNGGGMNGGGMNGSDMNGGGMNGGGMNGSDMNGGGMNGGGMNGSDMNGGGMNGGGMNGSDMNGGGMNGSDMNGGGMNGEIPEMSNGEISDGEIPEMPNGEIFDGKVPEMPDGGMAEMETFDGKMPDGFGGMNGNQTGTENSTTSSSDSDVSSKGIKVGCDAIGTSAKLEITGGTITVSSTGHCVHSTGDISISGTAVLNLTSDQKGISAHNEFYIDGGSVNIVRCTEGVESKNDMHIDGGSIIVAYSTDDGINVGNSGKMLYISDGYVEVTTSSGDTDGIDSNGDLIISGGFVFVKGGSSSGSVAGSIDTDGKVYVTGGTVVALGGICETPQSSSDANTVTMNRKSFSAGSYTIIDRSGNVIAEFTLAEAYTSAWFSSTDFVSGGSYTITKDGSTFASWTQFSKTQAIN